MTMQAYAWALEQKAGGPLAKIVLLHLADDFVPYAISQIADVSEIAESCECSVPMVLNALDALAERRLLSWSKTGRTLVRVSLFVNEQEEARS